MNIAYNVDTLNPSPSRHGNHKLRLQAALRAAAPELCRDNSNTDVSRKTYHPPPFFTTRVSLVSFGFSLEGLSLFRFLYSYLAYC
jgi:hypothetical protein